ncbi:MAG: serine O-acetyltransferase EpsC [Polyangia bacterium]
MSGKAPEDAGPRRAAAGCEEKSAALSSIEPASGRDLCSVVQQLCRGCETGGPRSVLRGPRCHALPSRDAVVETVERLRSALFPGYSGVTEISSESIEFHVGSTLDRAIDMLREQVQRGLCFTCEEKTSVGCPECEARSAEITEKLLERLPAVQRELHTDVLAAYESDPAARTPDEVVFCYPGIQAITYYRIAHELYLMDVPVIPRIITEHAHSVTGIDIHPGAAIGESFFVDHGTGVVVGETCRIGDRVRVYQGVTLGAKSFALDEDGNPVKGIPRHPLVEDDVIIYSGATILGRVTIGRDSVIGGNVWLSRSVPRGSRITQAAVRDDRFRDGAGI